MSESCDTMVNNPILMMLTKLDLHVNVHLDKLRHKNCANCPIFVMAVSLVEAA